MNAIELTCPYCNARVPEGAGSGGKVTCSRCGESFALKSDIQIPPGITPAASALPTPTLPPVGKPVARNRLVAAIIVGVMLLMAATGLTYMLLTQDTRREHDRALPRRTRRPPLPPIKEGEKLPAPDQNPVAPASLPTLGYLPASTHFVAGLHAGEILASPAGKDLRQRGLKIEKFELRLDAVKEALGLAPEEIDHAVLGATTPESAVPLVHLVVRTREPLDRPKLLQKLNAGKPRAEKTPSGNKRDIYPVTVQNLLMSLWLADDRTFVLGLLTPKLDLVPEKPAEGIGHFSPELRQAMEKRLSTGTPLWLVGHDKEGSKPWLASLLKTLKDVPMLDQMDKVRTFAVGVIPESPVKVYGEFGCIDVATAKKLEADHLLPRTKRDSAVKYSRVEDWLSVQWKPGS